MEGSALCLVFCSTLAALVSVIPVLCSLILRSLRGWVIYGIPLTVRFEENSSSKAQPWFYHLPHHHLSLSLGSANPRVIFILAPPGQCLSKCWSELSCLRGHLGETQSLVLLVASLIRCCPDQGNTG